MGFRQRACILTHKLNVKSSTQTRSVPDGLDHQQK